MKGLCECGCGRRATQTHHLVTVQETRRWKGKANDPRNLMRLNHDCHYSHHARSRVIPIEKLSDAALEFAFELMGPAAFYYLGRVYRGYDDPRLERLLEASESRQPGNRSSRS